MMFSSFRHRPWLVAALVLCAMLCAEAAWARVGGGGSYSGGSSSSGSSSSGSGGAFAVIAFELVKLLIQVFLLLPWQIELAIVVVVLGFILWNLRRDGPQEDIASSEPFHETLQHRARDGAARDAETLRLTGRPMLRGPIDTQAMTIDPHFVEVTFMERAVLLVTRSIHAIASGQQATMSPYLTEPGFGQLSAQLSGVSAVRGVVVGQLKPTSAKPIESLSAGMLLAIHVMVDLNIHCTVQGNAVTRHARQQWLFVRAISAMRRDDNQLDNFGCPGCGSTLERDAHGRCAHCGGSLQPGERDWSVDAVESMHQQDLPSALARDVVEQGNELPTRSDANVDSRRDQLVPEPAWSHFQQRSKDIFLNLQQAWSERALEKLRPFETDAVFQSHRFYLEEYARQRLHNRLDDVQLLRVVPCRVKESGGYVAVTCRMFATGRDYTVDDKQRVVAGSKDRQRPFSEYWTFVKKQGVAGGAKLSQCPACGAPLSISAAGVCSHCQAKVTSGQFDWVLSRIEQDEVYSR
jgi:uncharacterized Zn finger protein (UPF0148 family)